MVILHSTTCPNQPLLDPAAPLRVDQTTPTTTNPSHPVLPEPIAPAPNHANNDATVPTNNCTTTALQPPPTITCLPQTCVNHQPCHSPNSMLCMLPSVNPQLPACPTLPYMAMPSILTLASLQNMPNSVKVLMATCGNRPMHRDPLLGIRDRCHPWNQHNVLHPHLSNSPWLSCHLPPHHLHPLARKGHPTLHLLDPLVAGDHAKYLGNVSTKTIDTITAKLLFNSMISTLTDSV